MSNLSICLPDPQDGRRAPKRHHVVEKLSRADIDEVLEARKLVIDGLRGIRERIGSVVGARHVGAILTLTGRATVYIRHSEYYYLPIDIMSSIGP